MKKIAICYSGQPRDIENTFLNHQRFLINPLLDLGHQVDIFAHIWFDKSLINKPYWIDYPERGVWSKSTLDFILKKIKPKLYSFENQRKFDDTKFQPDQRFPHPISNTLSMFYGIEKVFEIKNKYSKKFDINYDTSIRIRPDLMFSKIFDDIEELSDDAINILLDDNRHTEYAIGDHFAIGQNDIMDLYSQVYSNFEYIINSGSAINPECLLGYWLKLNNIKIQTYPWKHCLYRDYKKIGFLSPIQKLVREFLG